MAGRHLQSLGRRLSRDTKLKEQYPAEIKRLLDTGYIEKVPDEEIDAYPAKTWYLSLFNIKHPTKPNKFRLVFDCAADSKGTSLNQRILQGPDMTNKLLGVLLRFRQEQIAMMADIEEMFHQVKVTPGHGDVLWFLWRNEGNMQNKPEVYCMTVHLFGGVWSPSCAGYALRRTAQDHVDEFNEQTTKTVLRNCLKSVDTEENAIKLATELCQLLSRGGFNLTKFSSNSKQDLNSIPKEKKAKEVKDLELDQNTLPVEHALGLEWKPETDQFSVRIKEKQHEKTKRGILSVLSSV